MQEGGFDPLIAHLTGPCPNCASLRADLAEKEERIALLEKVAEAARKPSGDDGFIALRHLIICNGPLGKDKCVCGMDQLRAALSALKEG